MTASAELIAPEPVELWLKVHRLRTATMHGDPTDRARIVAAVMGDFTAEDILTLHRLADRRSTPTGEAGMRERELEAVRSLREGNMLLDNEPVLYVKGYEQACLDAATAIAALKAITQ